MSQVFFLEHIILIGILFLLNVYNVDSFTDAAITASKHTNGQTMERPLQVCIMQFNIIFFTWQSACTQVTKIVLEH